MKTKEMAPRITYSPLSHRWFVLTKYRQQTGVDAVTGERKNFLCALKKYDITDQMVEIIHEVERRTLAKKRKKAA